jgi:hypothetical protein
MVRGEGNETKEREVCGVGSIGSADGVWQGAEIGWWRAFVLVVALKKGGVPREAVNDRRGT